MEYFQVLENQINDFILIFARVSSIIAFAPFFGAKNISMVIKAMAAFTFSLVFTAALSPMNVEMDPTFTGVMVQLIAEATVGAAIGFAASIFFEMVIFAGYIIDYMIGFGFINIVDPASGSSISIFAFFYSFFTLVIFLFINGHHILIEAMLRSYELIPAFGAGQTEMSLIYLTKITGDIFSTGFRIAAPIFTIMFMVDFSLGMLGKAVPQLQILVVGFPVKIAIGLMAMGIAFKPTVYFIVHLFEEYRETLMWVIKYWRAES